MGDARSPASYRSPRRPTSPPPPPSGGGRNGLAFLSPRPALLSSPDRPARNNGFNLSEGPPTSARSHRIRSLQFESQTPGPSSRIRSSGSPSESSSTTMSASKIHKLFSDFEKQKGVDESKWAHRLRELEEENSRTSGENEMLLFELDKARQGETRARKEADDYKEKAAQLRKETELVRREEEGRRRLLTTELEELKRTMSSSELAKQKLEKDLEASRRYSSQIEKELEHEKDRTTLLIETTTKRAIDREKSTWEKEMLERRTHFDSEMETLRKQLFDAGTRELKLTQEFEDAKRTLDKVRSDWERERHSLSEESSKLTESLREDLRVAKAAIQEHEMIRKQLDIALNESRRAEEMLAADLEDERSRAEQRTQLAVRRSMEREREERRVLLEQAEKESQRQRADLERLLDDATKKLSDAIEDRATVVSALEGSRRLVEDLQKELDDLKEKDTVRIDLACKRAVEKERLIWERQSAIVRGQTDREIGDLKTTILKQENLLEKQDRDLSETKKQLERARSEFEKERERIVKDLENKERDFEIRKRDFLGDFDALKTRLVSCEEARKRAERDANEAHRLTEAIEAEAISEREKFEARTEVAIKRAIERDRIDQKAQYEHVERENEKIRASLMKELDETRARLAESLADVSRLEVELDENKHEIHLIKLEMQRERASLDGDLDLAAKKSEKERRNLMIEKQQLEQKLEDLEIECDTLAQERNILVENQTKMEAEVANIQFKLNETTSREERMLEDMAELRDRLRERTLMDALPARPRPALTENLPPFNTSKRALETTSAPAAARAYSSSTAPRQFISSSRTTLDDDDFRPRSVLSSSPAQRYHASNTNGRAPLARRVANAKKLLGKEWDF